MGSGTSKPLEQFPPNEFFVANATKMLIYVQATGSRMYLDKLEINEGRELDGHLSIKVDYAPAVVELGGSVKSTSDRKIVYVKGKKAKLGFIPINSGTAMRFEGVYVTVVTKCKQILVDTMKPPDRRSLIVYCVDRANVAVVMSKEISKQTRNKLSETVFTDEVSHINYHERLVEKMREAEVYEKDGNMVKCDDERDNDH